ncbi:hypothetical protein NUW54_g2425 [Trametes sanguinea]|uniref:Uncharacterized protein n=1 Tax=Trametes sanguinea TaxID=158606 RepID=A0ACC1Q3L2_9APHY|nr:hypothetical protein NUW54_g2425 [Trametes sanguinea]
MPRVTYDKLQGVFRPYSAKDRAESGSRLVRSFLPEIQNYITQPEIICYAGSNFVPLKTVMPLELGGVTAHITCDGNELEVYDVKKEGDGTVTAWITFAVHWGEASSSLHISVQVYVDGRHARSAAHRSRRGGSVSGIREATDQLRRFRFSPILLTGGPCAAILPTDEWTCRCNLLALAPDNDAIAQPNPGNAELGTIRVAMFRVQKYLLSDEPYKPLAVSDIGAVHERSKKAGTHAVSFGEAEKVNRMKIYTPIGQEEEPFATFVFRYRPLELLQANGIVPLPPRPPKGKKRASDIHDGRDDAGRSTSKRQREDPDVKPDPEDDEDDEDDVDEVTFLREQMSMLQRRLEEAEAARRSRVVVKREVSPIRVPAASSQEVIDLT